MVVHAGLVEGGAAVSIPANREKNREFHVFPMRQARDCDKNPPVTGISGQLPYYRNRESF